jgi:hypothetical protein
MKDTVKRLSSAGLEIYSEEQLNGMLRRQIVEAFKTGRFSDALPDPYIHEIAAFAKQSLADGYNRMVLQLILQDRGLASFVYDIGVTSTGITISSAVDSFVPKKSSERKLPVAFEDYPRMAIDVSAA